MYCSLFIQDKQPGGSSINITVWHYIQGKVNNNINLILNC